MNIYQTLLLKPGSFMHSLWVTFMALLVLTQITKTCITLAFKFEIQSSSGLIFDEVLDAIFLIDIVVNFFTAFNEDVEVVTKFTRILWRYFSSYLLFDIVATLPTLVTYQMQDLYWFKLA